QDFEDFARAFAGIGKAQVRLLWSGEGQIVHLTVAAANGATIEPQSALLANLVRAIAAARAPGRGLCVGGYVKRTFHVGARVLADPRHEREAVLAAVEAALRAAFGFERRAFGQPVTAAELLGVIQGVPGVVAADLDQLFRDLFDLAGRAPLLIARGARWSQGQGGPQAGCAAILPAELLLIGSIALKEMAP
ncbi:MAG: putative baseplate assembly protein, partial [Chloroflexales bacterium]|nr:putative baseplate assembly protein [Chloroflexales bacterium]